MTQRPWHELTPAEQKAAWDAYYAAQAGLAPPQATPAPAGKNPQAVIALVMGIAGLLPVTWLIAPPVLIGFIGVIVALYAERLARVEGRPNHKLAMGAVVLNALVLLLGFF